MARQPEAEKGFKSLGNLASKISLPDRKRRNLRAVYLIVAGLLLSGVIFALFHEKDALLSLENLFSNFQASRSGSSQEYPQNPEKNTPPVINRFQFEIREPPASPNHQHALPEIRWCMALSRFLDDMRKAVHTSGKIESYNNRVQYYNDRCSKFSANAQARAQAQKDIDSLSAADLGALFDLQPETNEPKKATPMLSERQLGELQAILVQLGYMDAPVTGKMNGQTAMAIKAFQKDIDKPQTGEPDLETFTYLQIVYEDLLTWLETGAKPVWLK